MGNYCKLKREILRGAERKSPVRHGGCGLGLRLI
jgi:hypothetical protein